MFVEDMSAYGSRTIISMVPIMPALFPRLARVATTFHRIRYLSLVFEVQPQMGTSTTGGYILSFIKDATEVVPDGEAGLRKLFDQEGAIASTDWQPRSMRIINMPDLHYTEWNEEEPRWSSPGKLVLATDGKANVKGTLAIYCSWKVKLMESDYELQVDDTAITLEDSLGMKAGNKNIGVGSSFEDHNPTKFVAAIPGAKKGDKFKLPNRVFYLRNLSNAVAGIQSFRYFYWSDSDYLLPLMDDLKTEIVDLSYGNVEILSKGSIIERVYNKTENLLRGSKCICVQTNSGPFEKLLKLDSNSITGQQSFLEALEAGRVSSNMMVDYLESFYQTSLSKLEQNLRRSSLNGDQLSTLMELLKESLRALVPRLLHSKAQSINFESISFTFRLDFKSYCTNSLGPEFPGTMIYSLNDFVEFVVDSLRGLDVVLKPMLKAPHLVRATWFPSSESIEVV